MENSGLFKRIDVFAILSVCIPFAAYLLTLAPSVTFFDSGEFLTAIYSLGSAHSPGYPLFLNYAKPFTWMPFGNIAFRVNIATAVSAAAACYGAYLIVSHMLEDEELSGDGRFSRLIARIVSLAAALCFAFSSRLWLQSNHDKPYPLIAFISAMIFYLLLLWRDKYREGEEYPAYVYLGALLCGLAFGAHQTIVLLLPTFAFLILSMNWRLIGRVREIIIAFAFFLVGFSVHLHLPLRATTNPLLNWGDPKTLKQFLWHFLRKGYPVDKPQRDIFLVWDQLKAFNISSEFTWFGVAVLVLGLATFMARRRDEILSYLLGIVAFLLVITGYLNTPSEMIFLTEEFFTPLYLLSSVFMGLGLFALLKKGLASVPVEKLCSIPTLICVAVLSMGLPATLCALHYYENDQHENYIAYDYAANTLRTLPQGAALFTWGDSGAFPLWYLQGVEKMRDDLDLLHTPHLVFDWYLDAFPHLFTNSVLRSVPLETQPPESVLLLAINEQISKREVFIDFSTRYSVALYGYSLEQQGICYRLQKGGGVQLTPDLFPWGVYTLRGMWGKEMPFRDLDTGKAILIYANSYMEAGESLLRGGRGREGAELMQRAAEISPELLPQVNQTLQEFGGAR